VEDWVPLEVELVVPLLIDVVVLEDIELFVPLPTELELELFVALLAPEEMEF
jgi:hypothetical protein